MQISYTSSSEVCLKAKTETITLGDSVKIGAHKVSGQGEFDIASIQLEGHAYQSGLAYFIRTEELFVTYLTHIDKSATELDDISNTEVLVLDIRSNDTADSIKQLIKAIEPSYIFLIGSGATPTLYKDLNLPQTESSVLKLSKAALPEEGSFLVPNP